MLPLRQWPNSLRVSAIALGLLVVHAVSLATQLLLMHLNGGFPDSPDGPFSVAWELYSAEVLGGFAPGLAILVIGLAISISDSRRPDDSVAQLSRLIARGLAIVSVILIGLAFPLWARASW